MELLVQSQYEDFGLVRLYLVLSCLVVLSWRPAFFLKRNSGEVYLGEKGVGRSCKVGREGNCGLDALYKKRIYFQKKKERHSVLSLLYFPYLKLFLSS